MPFTRAYTKQLTDLSDEIKKALDLLFAESLKTFTDETGVTLNNNPNFNSLLNTFIGELDGHKQKELRGEKTSEHGSRQRLLALRQAWNEVLRLQQLILDKTLITQKTLDEDISTFTTIFNKATAKQIQDIFPEHEFTERKIRFVTDFMAVAHQLLKKQCAIQALLAANVTRNIEKHLESRALHQARETHNNAVVAHNKTWATEVEAHESTLLTLEKKAHQIDAIRLALLAEKQTLSTTNNAMNEDADKLASLEKTLADLVKTPINDDATIESLTAWDLHIEAAGEALIAGINAYRKNVIECTASTAKNTNAFISDQNKTLDDLEEEARACQPQPLDEENFKTSLATLDPSYLALCHEIDEEIIRLETHFTALTALKKQHETDNAHTKEALRLHLVTLANHDTDTTILERFNKTCIDQHDFHDFGSTPWKKLSQFTATQFQEINTLNETNQGLSQSQSTESILDTSAAKTIKEAITETTTRLAQLKENKATITNQYNKEKKQGAGHLNSGTKTVKEKIESSLEECEKITDELIAFNNESTLNDRLLHLNQARETARSANKKRRDLLEKINLLQPLQNEADYLTQRIQILEEKFKNNPFPIEADISPDALKTALNALSVNIALTTPNLMQKFNPLEALIAKVDTLEQKMTETNQSYRYRRRGTLIGALVGGALSLVLLGGLVTSIVLSFGLTLPITIGVGVIIASSPALFGGIGRFFGWRTDKTVNKQMTHQNNTESLEKKSEINTRRNTHTLAREQSMASQLSLVQTTEQDLDAFLANEQKPRTAKPLTRRSTVRKSIWDFKYLAPGSENTSILNLATPPTPEDDETVAPSFDPELERKTTPPLNQKIVRFAEEEVISSHKETNPSFEAPLNTATPPHEVEVDIETEATLKATQEPKAKPAYSLFTGGDFGVFSVSFASPQQAQGETSEPVVANAHRV
ncbi:MAG TPA: hypothetical protein VFU82_03275 [Gammaproteobacteria bacterium]|nr:hypothetical protein [Gammaproteobacteria bacterium]